MDSNVYSEVLGDLQCFVALQVRLINAFRISFPQVSDFNFMIDAPKEGTVETEGGPWLFKKHGAGLAFRNRDGIIIDVHKHVGLPEVFDAWRVELYLESIGKLAGYKNGDRIESILSKLASLGKLVRCEENLFRLSARLQSGTPVADC